MTDKFTLINSDQLLQLKILKTRGKKDKVFALNQDIPKFTRVGFKTCVKHNFAHPKDENCPVCVLEQNASQIQQDREL